jgi:hypothetical protein
MTCPALMPVNSPLILFGPPPLPIFYLQCQVAVLRSNPEKHRLEFLVIRAGSAPLVRGCPTQIALRFV